MTQTGPLPEVDETNRHFWTGGAAGDPKLAAVGVGAGVGGGPVSGCMLVRRD